MRRWQRTTKQRPLGRTLGPALLLFFILCGAALLLAGRSSSPQPERVSPRARVQEAIASLEQARLALDATDYGKARRQLARTRATLELLAATVK